MTSVLNLWRTNLIQRDDTKLRSDCKHKNDKSPMFYWVFDGLHSPSAHLLSIFSIILSASVTASEIAASIAGEFFSNCEDFLATLLEHNFKIQGIRHEGVDLVNGKFDKMIKTAAGVMATKHICAALGIDSVEACRRFSLPA